MFNCDVARSFGVVVGGVEVSTPANHGEATRGGSGS